MNSAVVHRVSLMPGAIDQFAAQIDQEESALADAAAKEIVRRREEALVQSVESFVNFLHGK